MSTSKANDSIVTILTNRVSAIQKYLKPEKATIPVAGKILGVATLLGLYQKSLEARAAVVAGRATYKGALSERDTAETSRLAADESLKAWVLARFGAGSTEATEFGFAPKRAPATTVETKALAVKKRQATREARGTMGKKQKLQIKGVVATPTAPAAPASPPPIAVNTPAAVPASVAAPAASMAVPPPTASNPQVASAVPVAASAAALAVPNGVAHS
jgi:hypothetical protein